MTRKQDVDQLLRAWTDFGDDRLPPSRLAQALDEIKVTRQRRPLRSQLDAAWARFQPVVAPAAIAIIVLLGSVALALRERVADPPPPSAVPSARAALTADSLESVTLAGTEILMGLDPDRSIEGSSALFDGLDSPSLHLEMPGLVAARFDDFTGLVNHARGPQSTIATFASLWSSADDARHAYRSLVAAHSTSEAWTLVQDQWAEPIGDESVVLRGGAYGRGEVGVFLWRDGNLVLAAFSLDGTSTIHARTVARRMAAEVAALPR